MAVPGVPVQLVPARPTKNRIVAALTLQPVVLAAAIDDQRFFVLGEVARAGEFPLAGPTTVLQALALAGGLNEYGIAAYKVVDGFAQKGHRALMQFMLIPENGPRFFRDHEEDFRDVFAYISSLRPPKYAGPINEQLAEQGWEFLVVPWHEAPAVISDLTRGLKLGADGPFPGATDVNV